MSKLFPEGLIPHVKVKTMEPHEHLAIVLKQVEDVMFKPPNRTETLNRANLIIRLTDFLKELHPDSPVAKLLYESQSVGNYGVFGYDLFKYLDEFEAEKIKEDE
jgi:hypothetical protein